MAYFKENKAEANDKFTHVYDGIDKDELAQKLHKTLTSFGYKLKSGSHGSGTYEKGNRTMRILFGAFVKYFKMEMAMKAAEDGTVLMRVKKATSGMSGGVIGVAQVKKEMKRLNQLMRSV